MKQLRADAAKITAEQDKQRSAQSEVALLMRRIPAESGTTLFIESLYRIAREAGLKQTEVTSDSAKAGSSARPGGSNAAPDIVKHQLKVSSVGNFRTIAEFIRLLQNQERLNQIIDLKLTPDPMGVKAALTLELYSLPVKP